MRGHRPAPGAILPPVGHRNYLLWLSSAWVRHFSWTEISAWRYYDRVRGKDNLELAPKDLSAGGTYAALDDFESGATKGSLTVGGHNAYSLHMNAREGYRLTLQRVVR